ncbi:hypothetical protein DH2020_007504 [Rehmannia glutinosa]|uniref:RNase H type-1 domain-containing protein n=1 Tax=Rehmannia glutinosa TaxID=99300 RepID=A0ABR0TYA0_REHGL
MVIWRAPQPPQIKLNTDGSFDPGTLIAGGGGLIRDHLGRLMLAFHSSFQAVSSFHAELLALEMGLRHARRFSLQIWIELDAAAVVTTITSGGLGSWQVQHTLIRIRNMLRDLQYSISHIHREGNRPADHLAELGAAALGSHFVDEGTASHHLLALIRMDQLGYPSFRFS